ncbi:MAG: DUF1385 domain-containing protein [Lachnospiraceae bacterium]|nr:DUF1385 domain-containing protein [Lachnospiraceae bacterium]
MKASGIGGQAVMEGIMMKNGDTYAVAVRKPDNEIVVKKDVDHSYQKHEKIRKVPFLRGVFSFIDSLVLGMSTLTFSAEFYEEEEKPSKLDIFLEKIMGGYGEKFIMGVTVALSIVLAVGIFMVCPFLLAELLKKVIVSDMVLALVEGAIRVGILLGYIWLISRLEDIQRVFRYHGAEHKCINCIENGLELNVENVMKSSKEHKRCGTSFLLLVMVLSIIFFLFIRVDSVWLRMVLRILLIPVIAGVSYELIQWAGRNDNKAVDILSKPGMLLQYLTTSEPDEAMVEVAIKAVEAVFDWQEFLKQYNAQGIAEEKAKAKTDGILELSKEIKRNEEKESQAVKSSSVVKDMVDNTENDSRDNDSMAKQAAKSENPVDNSHENSESDQSKDGPTSIIETDDSIKAPRIIAVDDSEEGVIKISWEKVKKVSGYVIYRKEGEEENYKMYPDVKKNHFEDREVQKKVTYYYRIRGYRLKDNKRIYGQLSPIESNGYSSKVKSKY